MTRPGRLFLDSADLDHAALAAGSGVVAGITTNPAIMAASTNDPHVRVRELLAAIPDGLVFHQLTSTDADQAAAEATAVRTAAGAHVDRLVLKLPAQPFWYSAASSFTKQGWPVAFTAVYAPGQVVCAVEAGAGWIIPYVDRSARLLPDEPGVVERLRPFLPDEVVLLAASLKSPDQALDALRTGADAVTTTWEVLVGLMSHPLTETAIEEFLSATRRPSMEAADPAARDQRH
jgi:TalC/MipB family fructose-6-phosphate aldolase